MALSPPQPSKRLRLILQHYGLRTFRTHTCRSLYKKKAAYRVITDQGSLLLKPYHGETKLLKRIHSRLAWLKENHFESMPQWHMTDQHKQWVTQNGRLYYVTDWIEGAQLGEDVHHYEKLGEVLARLHLISRRRSSVRPSYTKMEIHRFRKRHKTFARRLRSMQKNREGSNPWFREYGDQCLSLAEEAWHTLRRKDVKRILRKEKSSIIHGDVTRPNIIVNADGVYLVDWERMRRGSAYYEVAKTLNNATGFSVSKMKAFLDGYDKICPLKPEERLIISSLCRLPREAWMAADPVRSIKQSNIFNIVKLSWNNRLEAIRWLDAWARQQPYAFVDERSSRTEEEVTRIEADPSSGGNLSSGNPQHDESS